jgi:hypothetical protein
MEMRKPTVSRLWFDGREFRRITWPATDNFPAVTLVWAVWEHINTMVFRGALVSRRVQVVNPR